MPSGPQPSRTKQPGTDPKPEKRSALRARKRVAGQDPVKRDQILDGAKRCFLTLGFEAASMNEITAEAGVSKGTIYVYFDGKEDLFSALIDREKSRFLSLAVNELDETKPMPEALTRFGSAIALMLTTDELVRAQRMVLGVAERMPGLARRFFGPDPFSAVTVLRSYLEKRAAAGEVRIDDFDLAARQLLELSMTWIFKSRLFGNMPPFSREEATRIAGRGVDLFLSYYGTQPPPRD